MTIEASGVASMGARGQSAPLTTKKLPKIRKQGENQEKKEEK